MKIASNLSIINLDANASVPPLPAALSALTNALAKPGNASSTHVLGRNLRIVLDDAREQVALSLGCLENELFFCSGASEGNRWVVDALVRTGESRGSPLSVLSSPLEHPSLAKYLEAAASQGKIKLEKLSLKEGLIDSDDEKLGRSEAVFVTAAHNETGYVPDLELIGTLVSQEAILISDASQAVARIGALPKRVDVIVASSHKMGGVVGAGAVAVRGRGQTLRAPWAGGGQEAGLRPGSEPVALIAAMGEAAKWITQSRTNNQALAKTRDQIENELLAAWEGAFVVGNNARRLPQTSAICVQNVDAEALRIAVDQAGVCVGFGSACSALAPEPSPSLLAFGLTAAQARATIRISLFEHLSESEIVDGICRLKDLVRRMMRGH